MTGSTRPDGSTASRAGDPPGISRRTLLRGAGVAAGAGMVGATATTPAAAQNGFGGWLDNVGNYDGTVVDMTGRSEVTVEVGAEGNGGTFAFAPPAVRVSPGTSITFEWTSDNHNVLVEDQPDGADWAGLESLENSGYTYSHTFETEGVYKYFCQPHLSLGMKGVVVVEAAQGGDGGDGGGGGVPAEYGDWFTGSAKGGAVANYDGTTVDKTGQSEVTVEVGAEGNGGTFAYAPPAVRVSPGTTVVFEWTSDNHNVVVEDQPDGAGWSGQEALKNTGFTYSHTFETEGVYKYFCQPHLSLGMKGAIVVGPPPGGGDGGGGGDVQAPTGPPSGVTAWEVLAFGLGSVALLSPFGVYYYQKRREVPADGESGRDEHGAIREAPEEDLEEIGHEEYDPWGTLSLIIVYFLILVGLWIFMYFVEFLGNGPTVIG